MGILFFPNSALFFCLGLSGEKKEQSVLVFHGNLRNLNCGYTTKYDPKNTAGTLLTMVKYINIMANIPSAYLELHCPIKPEDF